ncbi:MAG TPA: YdcH family protein [Myxococcota bacterium]|jgi:uncharacterized protein YdcH (DUF465 family)|nr:YdcH family protein [Myxococcota bacterium]
MNADETRTVEKLREEHRMLDQKLAELNGRRFLAPDEEYEMKRLHKLKLAKKDQIAMLLSRSS